MTKEKKIKKLSEKNEILIQQVIELSIEANKYENKNISTLSQRTTIQTKINNMESNYKNLKKVSEKIEQEQELIKLHMQDYKELTKLIDEVMGAEAE